MARPRKRDATELSKFLDAALLHKGLTHTAFSMQIGWKSPTFSDLKLREETSAPDRKTIHHWAKVLELTSAQEAVLFDLVQLAHSPKYVQDLVARLRPLKSLKRPAESPLDYELPE
jgi:hypothetical protein